MYRFEEIVVACLVVCLSMVVVLTTTASAQEKKPRPQVLFTHVNVWDGKSDKLLTGRRVLVEGNLIKTIGGKDLKARKDAKVINGGGRTLIPGMIDTHVHLAYPAPIGTLYSMPHDEMAIRTVPVAKDFLMRGFTTVRDFCANSHGLRRAINAGVVPGPRIVSAGACISARSGHGDWSTLVQEKGESHMEKLGHTRIVSGPYEMRTAIREEMRRGASFIKLMMGGGLASEFDPVDATTFSLEEIQAAVDETKNWGTYVSAHVFTDHGVRLGLKAGMKTFDHTNLASEETYKILGERKIPIGAQVHFIKEIKGPAKAAFTTPEQRRKAAIMIKHGDKIFAYGKKYGVKFGFGVDLYGDVAATRLTSKAIVGRRDYFSDREILKHIYENNMILINMSGERLPYKEGPLGVIKAGAYADILLVKGNPLRDISVLADWKNKIDLVMKDGVIYRSSLK